MASSNERKSCFKCPKGFGQVMCGGCEQWFCFKHLDEHREKLGQQMDDIIMQHDQLHHTLAIDKNPQDHPLMRRVDRWEQQSIRRIEEVANKVRQQLKNALDRSNRNIEELLKIDLTKWMKQLKELRERLDNPPMIEITNDEHDGGSSTHLPLIQLRLIRNNRVPSLISSRTRWSTNGVTVAGGHGQGHALNQLNRPYGIDIGEDGTLFITDTYNHRVMRWKRNAREGEIIVGVKGEGNRTDQLDEPLAVLFDRMNNCLIISEERNERVMRWSLDKIKSKDAEGKVIISNIYCLGLALDDEGSLYVADFEREEVRRYGHRDGVEGVIVAGGNGQGDALNQLWAPETIFVDDNHSVYVSNAGNHRVMRWMKNAREGIIVAGGQGQGNGVGQLSYPTGMFVDRMGLVYVADQWNDRVMRWLPNVKEGEVIVGGDGRGTERNQLKGPDSISMDHQGNLYVVDLQNHRIQRFDVE